LVWLGCADPAATRQAILDSDPKRDELIDVMQLWHAALGEMEIEVSYIAEHLDLGPVKKLHDKLVEVACRGHGWNGKSVGWWLRRNKDRVVGGGQCFRSGSGRNGQQWRLVVVAAGQAQLEGV
jgi:hypothetical protein